MASCEVCQHCSDTMRPSEAVSRQGFSYHKKCEKCYVCSETDLQKAEVFRGVIFCASCAKRIFRGCATARGARPRARRRRVPRALRHSVIERARAAPSSSSETRHTGDSEVEPAAARELSVSHDCYCVSDVVTQARKLINFIYYQSHNLVKSDKAEISQSAEMCKHMLDILNCPALESKHPSAPPEPHLTCPALDSILKLSSSGMGTSRTEPRPKLKPEKVRKDNGPCSDLRIAELGASTEIATMALRKNSRKKVKSSTKTSQKSDEPETFSMFSNLDSVLSRTSNEEYLDSECHDYRGSTDWDGGMFDHTVASIIKIPYKSFKKKIIERSSLISVIAGIETEKESFYKRLKSFFHEDEEILDHHRNGYRKLYRTINKNTTPYKLGWLDPDQPVERKPRPCKHFHECHSYRCMREQVMRLAGPTKSRMDTFRANVKKVVIPPFLKKLSFQIRNPAIMRTAACGKSASGFVHKSPEPGRKEQHLNQLEQA